MITLSYMRDKQAMIDIEQATCKRCGKPIELKEIGPNKREWCSPACKQAAYREREKERRLETSHHSGMMERIAQLEQELARYRQIADLMDRAKMEARFMELGEQVQYHTLTTLTILGGHGYWFDFMKRAKDEDLLKAIAAA